MLLWAQAEDREMRLSQVVGYRTWQSVGALGHPIPVRVGRYGPVIELIRGHDRAVRVTAWHRERRLLARDPSRQRSARHAPNAYSASTAEGSHQRTPSSAHVCSTGGRVIPDPASLATTAAHISAIATSRVTGDSARSVTRRRPASGRGGEVPCCRIPGALSPGGSGRVGGAEASRK